MTVKKIAVFLDRDGTINEEVGYLDNLEKIVLYPGVIPALKLIRDHNMKSVVVTNQSGVARGICTEQFVSQAHSCIQEMLRHRGVSLDAFYYCPHHPRVGLSPYRTNCLCRKPGVAMFHKAADDMGIDLTKSYMIGDTVNDIEAAGNAGVIGILVKTGYGMDALRELCSSRHKAHYIAEDILEAVEWIIKDRMT